VEGDEQLLQELVEPFLVNAQHYLTALRDVLTTGDIAAFTCGAQTMEHAANIGVQSTSAAALQLEQ
jgi:hypothetical protein